jgi:DNA end-binding protein Ku
VASTVWKGYITFGLISIPIRLFAAARSQHVSFHQVHAECNTRIKQQLYCPTCERVVPRSELVKGYEVDKTHFVQVTDEEMKKIEPRSSDTMEISEFVKISDIDPLYYESSYYAVPEDPGRKAYHLLLETMEKAGYAALAKVGMHRREYIVVIRPRENGLTLHTMYYPDEVRKVPEYGAKDNVQIKPQEIELAEQLVKKLAAPFHPERYEDEYKKRVLELVEAKTEGKQVEGEPKRRMAPVIDLMQALQKSLGEAAAKKKPATPARAAASKHAKVRRRAS